MAAYLTNALLYHPLRHPHMEAAVLDLDPELAPSLIPCENMPYSKVVYIDASGHSTTFQMEAEIYERTDATAPSN